MVEPTLYFNEIDPFAAGWLRQLWPDAVVDPRSIADVSPADVSGFRRGHFFGGIGGWEYALQLARWPGDWPVWTGSCPCQPFSVAGKQRGVDDKRHLWPVFRDLIAEQSPAIVFGEQVASKAGREWLSGVRADLEALGYAVGAADLSAAGAGSPHVRQRLFWVAHLCRPGLEEWPEQSARQELSPLERSRLARGLGDAPGQRRREERPELGRGHQGGRPQGRQQRSWDDFDVVPCRDGKTRRFKPGIFPMAPRLPEGMVLGGDPGPSIDPENTQEARVMRLKGYGNSIIPELAAEFISAFLDTLEAC